MENNCPVCHYNVAYRIRRSLLTKLMLPGSKKYQCGRCKSLYITFEGNIITLQKKPSIHLRD